MSEMEVNPVNRRDFLQTTAAATATATAALSAASTGVASAQEPAAKKAALLPKRVLGKTGVEVSMLNQGTWRAPDSLDRLLRLGYAGGIRYIDTAKSYGTEPGVGKFLSSLPDGARKDIFLVTKDGPRTPSELIPLLDKRIEALKTDYVDLFFIHGIGGKAKLGWPKSKELADTIDKIKKSGKAKFVGFSCHDALKVEFLNAAAEGKIVDAIMVAYDPFLDRGAPLNKAIDACHKAGIGLISMKQFSGHENAEKLSKEIEKRVPSLKEKGLNPFQALLTALWSDERFSSSCVSMRNTDHLRQNIEASKNFQPLKQAEIDGLREAILVAGTTFCANCDGSCSRAAGTEAALGDLARLVTYHDQHGFRGEARRLYSEMDPASRDWSGADLAAAREACHNKLDFARLLRRVEDNLA